MKYIIYYTEDKAERTRAEIEHLLDDDVAEESVQRYLTKRWSEEAAAE